MKYIKKILVFVCALVCFGAIFYCAYRWDLQINQFLFTPKNAVALAAEFIGWWPLYLCIPLLGWAVLINFKRSQKALGKKIAALALGLLFAIGGSIALFNPACGYLVKRGYEYFGGGMYLLLSAVAVIMLGVWAWFSRISNATVYKLGGYFVFLSFYMVAHNIIINIMKSLWSRTRFDTMLNAGEGFGDFTSWLTVGGNGGTSFPSGHTGAAATVLLLVFLRKLFTECKGDEWRFLFVGYVYSAVVAFGRVMIGRHYLSDVTVSILIVTISVAVLWYLPPVKKYFEMICKNAEKYTTEIQDTSAE